MSRRAAIAAVLAGSLVACGGGGSDDAPATAGNDPCDAARAVSDLDDEFQGEINSAMQTMLDAPSPDGVDAAIEDLVARLDEIDTEPLLDAYEDLEAELDGEPSDAARTLRAFTADVIDQLRSADSAAEIFELLEQLGSDEDTVAAGQAALELDAWSREACDVVIAD